MDWNFQWSNSFPSSFIKFPQLFLTIIPENTVEYKMFRSKSQWALNSNLTPSLNAF